MNASARTPRRTPRKSASRRRASAKKRARTPNRRTPKRRTPKRRTPKRSSLRSKSRTPRRGKRTPKRRKTPGKKRRGRKGSAKKRSRRNRSRKVIKSTVITQTTEASPAPATDGQYARLSDININVTSEQPEFHLPPPGATITQSDLTQQLVTVKAELANEVTKADHTRELKEQELESTLNNTRAEVETVHHETAQLHGEVNGIKRALATIDNLDFDALAGQKHEVDALTARLTADVEAANGRVEDLERATSSLKVFAGLLAVLVVLLVAVFVVVVLVA